MRRTFFRSLATFVTAVFAVIFLAPSIAWAAAPGAPTAILTTAGNTQVALTWTAPTSTGGGGGISDYIIEHSKDSGMTFTRFIDSVSATASVTVTGLTNGTAYIFRVYAVNSGDVGPSSVYSGSVTPFVWHTANDPATYSACPTGLIPASGFTDVSTTDASFVNCIKYYGITKGTTEITYSPMDTVTRWQMALFLTRMGTRSGITLPSGTVQGFTDISSYSTEIQTAINQLKQLGITIGKTATTYGPADDVTREEMALFITRLLKKAQIGPGGNEEYISGTSGAKEIKSNDTDINFTDLVGATTFEVRNAVINLFNLGITDSQAFSEYQPKVKMNRKAMAIFMANALSHTNARPTGLVLQASTYRAPASPVVYFSVTNRDANFAPIVGTQVDVFKYTISGSTLVARFNSLGNCKDTVATSVGSIKCQLDSGDPKTNSLGNLAIFFETIPLLSTQEIYVWEGTPVTVYDNDIHGAAVKMVSVTTHA